MARDGNGDFTLADGPFINGTIADADEMMAILDDMADGLSDSINIAGTKAWAANQDLGGFKITGSAAPSADNDLARKKYIDDAITGLSATYQSKDATLTAFAGLTTADDRMLDFTGVDTMAVVTYATVLSNIGALNQTAGDARYARFGAGNTWTAGQTFNAAIIIQGGNVLQLFESTNTHNHRAYVNGSNELVWEYDGGGEMTLDSTGLTVPVKALTGVSGTLTTTHRNRHLELSGGVTMPNSVFTAQDKQTFDPGTSNRTFTRGSGVTMYVNGVDSASATLAANQMGGAHWRSASVVVLTGAFT